MCVEIGTSFTMLDRDDLLEVLTRCSERFGLEQEACPHLLVDAGRTVTVRHFAERLFRCRLAAGASFDKRVPTLIDLLIDEAGARKETLDAYRAKCGSCCFA